MTMSTSDPVSTLLRLAQIDDLVLNELNSIPNVKNLVFDNSCVDQEAIARLIPLFSALRSLALFDSNVIQPIGRLKKLKELILGNIYGGDEIFLFYIGWASSQTSNPYYKHPFKGCRAHPTHKKNLTSG
ncbi:hypothetical protein BGX24_012679 [Mortierella sp. AD032]|nr:hypothetical protein BGX24_012679 [Mortierella sp. AD032]